MATIGFEWNQADDIVNHLKLESYKTLILSDGEYKRYNEGNSAKINEANVIPNMTSNTTPNGVASASSVFTEDFEAWKAFDGQHDFGSGYGSWGSANAELPQWLQYKFDKEIAIGKYAITNRDRSGRTDPTAWVFLGSKNGVDWVELDKREGQVNWNQRETRYYEFENLIGYSYYKLTVQEAEMVGSTSATVLIGELEMFETPIHATPPSWQTISTTLPTSQQFQEEGMEDLTVFDRKIQSTLNSPINMTNETLGEGKVFRGRVDLKKIVDLRKLEVK